MSEQQVKTRPAGPVTGERAPVLHVLAPSTPMARMIRERLAAEDAEAVSGESGDEPIPEA